MSSPKTVCAGCGEKDGGHSGECTDLVGVKVRLEKRVKELEEALEWSRDHAAVLDQNWSTLHESSMSAIREAVGDPNASVPEIVDFIREHKK